MTELRSMLVRARRWFRVQGKEMLNQGGEQARMMSMLR